jgi:hypothetical protein
MATVPGPLINFASTGLATQSGQQGELLSASSFFDNS